MSTTRISRTYSHACYLFFQPRCFAFRFASIFAVATGVASTEPLPQMRVRVPIFFCFSHSVRRLTLTICVWCVRFFYRSAPHLPFLVRGSGFVGSARQTIGIRSALTQFQVVDSRSYRVTFVSFRFVRVRFAHSYLGTSPKENQPVGLRNAWKFRARTLLLLRVNLGIK